MIRRIAFLCLVLVTVGAGAGFATGKAEPLGTEKNPIIWAFVPSVDTARVSAGSQKVAELLFKSTGLYFKTFIATDYVGVIEALRAKPPKANMSSLATAAYILAADQKVAQAALVSVRNGTAFYKGEIVTRPDTGIKTIADIKGKTFARVDPLSASGWIIPSLMLKAAGINLDKDIKVVDAGSHPGVVTAVYSGQADAGACFVDARAQVVKDKPDVMEKVVVIKESGEIPNDGVQFHPSVKPELRTKIVDALLALIKTDEGKKALGDAYQWAALEKHDDSFYDGFRQVLQAAGVTAEVLMPKK
jgi:phosphonate transport system substrate-binding protein